jgi:membrane protease YdiL (CAAX protease family)
MSTLGIGVFAWWACPIVAGALLNTSLQHSGPISPDQVEFYRVTLFNLVPMAAMLYTWQAWKSFNPKDQKKRFDFVEFGIYLIAVVVFMVGALQTLKLPPFPGISNQNQSLSQQNTTKI